MPRSESEVAPRDFTSLPCFLRSPFAAMRLSTAPNCRSARSCTGRESGCPSMRRWCWAAKVVIGAASRRRRIMIPMESWLEVGTIPTTPSPGCVATTPLSRLALLLGNSPRMPPMRYATASPSSCTVVGPHLLRRLRDLLPLGGFTSPRYLPQDTWPKQVRAQGAVPFPARPSPTCHSMKCGFEAGASRLHRNMLLA